MEILVFEVESQRYGLPTATVQEVVRAVSVTPLPGGPDVIEGLFNVRGKMSALLDVRRRFGYAPRPLHPSHHFVLARAGGRSVALHVDQAVELLELPEGDVGAVEALTPEAGDLFVGLARLDDGLLLIHDLEAFLSEAEAMELDSALADDAAGGQEPPEVEPRDGGA